MKIALIVLGVLVGLIALVAFVGWLLPVRHHASSEATFAASPEVVYQLLDRVEEYPAWRPKLTSVEIISTSPGQRSFREMGSDGPMTFVVEEAVPGKRFVTRIADKSLPFGGSWTYELIPVAGGTTLRITEDGEVYNPIFRFVSRFIMGHHATMNEYLTAMGARLGSTAVIRESA